MEQGPLSPPSPLERKTKPVAQELWDGSFVSQLCEPGVDGWSVRATFLCLSFELLFLLSADVRSFSFVPQQEESLSVWSFRSSGGSLDQNRPSPDVSLSPITRRANGFGLAAFVINGRSKAQRETLLRGRECRGHINIINEEEAERGGTEQTAFLSE